MKIDLKSLYKSSDTEEWWDTVFTRPIGMLFTKLFYRLHWTPNQVTVLSIILGVCGAWFFHYRADNLQGLLLNVCGVVLFMTANFLDSADGQLARLTGLKTKYGRILDGVASNIIFVTLYFSLVFRLYSQNIPFTNTPWHYWIFIYLLFNGIVCHGRQCSLSDYYRNVHLYFINAKNGNEFDHYADQLAKYKSIPFSNVLEKFFMWLYKNHMKSQEGQTPQFQKFYALLRQRYGDYIPQDIRDEFRRHSLPLMKFTNILTHNTRASVLYITSLFDVPWLYPMFETVVLSILYWYMRLSHEHFCKKMSKALSVSPSRS